ncbi:MAG: hypothetical protein AB7E51_06865 [Pseudodesulfovibrio sp.]|uniref:hypothetical protein n=1 Tax=Pseudodesulfovibrio sp. TaxID=2035812 RepID=UPI003D0BDE95
MHDLKLATMRFSMRLTFLALLFAVIMLGGCRTTGEKMSDLYPGMTQAQTMEKLGRPDSFRSSGEYEIYTYSNRLMSGWAWDRSDYHVIFKNEKLVEYGHGEVRQNNPNTGTLVLVPVN